MNDRDVQRDRQIERLVTPQAIHADGSHIGPECGGDASLSTMVPLMVQSSSKH